MAGQRKAGLSPLMTCTVLLLLSVMASILLWSSLGFIGPGQAARTSQTSRSKSNKITKKGYGPGFYNHSGCLYAHLGDEGHFEMTTADEFRINETLDLDTLEFDSSKSKCSSQTQSGKLSFSFKLSKNKRIGSIAVTMRILPPDTDGYWEVSQANLTVTRADIERKRTFALKMPAIHAGADYSYSCSDLVLTTQPKRRQPADNETSRADPSATLVLPRFQLQPFSELETRIFAASYDCASWFTIPGLMGLLLVLFMTLVTVLGVLLLKGIETNDFKFNKEGLQFTQAQMETNKTR